MNMRRKVSQSATALGAIAAVSLALAPTAAAEGSFSSSLTGVATGFNSRWWTDKNTDGAGTVIKFTSCSLFTGPGFRDVTVQLSRYRPVIADVNEGQKTFSACASGATSSGNWGDKQAADYRFAIMKINGSTSGYRLDVDTVGVSY
ncbi:hypothetical protein ACFVZW_18285 [Streptomyces sp. NPDC059567]|uniref:hypothetical protein n=1 Tax=Streptomyces sp. NPDC059567 TaxID=3346867 RepID=UPI003686EC03